MTGNKRQAQLIGAGSLDIYLRHSDSGVFVDTWKDIANSQGFVNFRVNDSMWDDRALSIQSGQTQDFPFNFIIATHGRALTGDEPPQATFTARREYFR